LTFVWKKGKIHAEKFEESVTGVAELGVSPAGALPERLPSRDSVKLRSSR